MTIETRETVLELLEEDPMLRVYQYQHTSTGKTLYAVFPHGQYDDMHDSPEVTNAALLYDAGHPTPLGHLWKHF